MKIRFLLISVVLLFVQSSNSYNVTNFNYSYDRFKRDVSLDENSLFKSYWRYNQIMSYIKELAAKYPNIVEVLDIGYSVEGRSLPCIKISNNRHSSTRPMILVDGGIHAREWVSHSTALYLIHQLVENSKNTHMFSEVDWLIIPVLNPDGYEYSHTHFRMWRKNRAKGIKCNGVDLNRNFDFHWREKDSSADECTEIYAGPKPFSEPETQNFRNIVTKYKNNIKLYITLHAFGNIMLFPWSYTENVIVDNHKEHDYVGKKMRNAIEKVRGTRYKVGASTVIYDTISGVSDDWVKGVLGVPLIYTIELPKGGPNGFDPPTNYILPIGCETFEGFKVASKYIAETYGSRRRSVNKLRRNKKPRTKH